MFDIAQFIGHKGPSVLFKFYQPRAVAVDISMYFSVAERISCNYIRLLSKQRICFIEVMQVLHVSTLFGPIWKLFGCERNPFFWRHVSGCCYHRWCKRHWKGRLLIGYDVKTFRLLLKIS